MVDLDLAVEDDVLPSATPTHEGDQVGETQPIVSAPPRGDFVSAGLEAEVRFNSISNIRSEPKEWFYWKDNAEKGCILRFISMKDSCSIRKFDAETGTYLGKPEINAPGPHREAPTFRRYIQSDFKLEAKTTNILYAEKFRLPDDILKTLKAQIRNIKKA